MPKIHPSSVIHPNAQIGKGTVIEPFVHVAEDVIIGENNWIGANVSIMDGTRIGNEGRFFPGAVIGAIPQDLKFGGEKSLAIIGNNVTIRECVTINRGTKDRMKTEIKDNCLLMAYVHIAHDCIIEANCILANNVTLAGHINIGEYAILGGMSAVHQFVNIGEHVMIGGASKVRKDVPPFVKAGRDPLAYVGVNSIGLKRRGYTTEQVEAIKDVYRLIYVQETNMSKGVKNVINSLPQSAEKTRILQFIEETSRGLMKGFRHS